MPIDFTTSVRNFLSNDYDIHDIPNELLDYLVTMHSAEQNRNLVKASSYSTHMAIAVVANNIATDWEHYKRLTDGRAPERPTPAQMPEAEFDSLLSIAEAALTFAKLRYFNRYASGARHAAWWIQDYVWEFVR